MKPRFTGSSKAPSAETRVYSITFRIPLLLPDPAQRPDRRASPALTRYVSCHEPHDPRPPDGAPAAFLSPRSHRPQTLASSTPRSRLTCSPQDNTAAPAVTP